MAAGATGAGPADAPTGAPARQPSLLIVNLAAGGGRSRRYLPDVLEELARGGIHPVVHLTGSPGEAAEVARAAAARCRLVMAAGGDGTVNEVLNGIAGSRVPLGIIPMGTQNVLAMEFGIPDSPREAAAAIVRGHVRTIDLGRANGRYFAVMAGVGFDALVVSKVKLEVKKLFGGAAYALAALVEALSYEPEPIHVTLDGVRETTGYFVVVGNARHYTREFTLTPQADMNDGLLDVVVFRNRDLLDHVKVLLGSTMRPATRFPEVETCQAREIRLTSPREVLGHVDCEILGPTPITIRVAPGALGLIVPAARPVRPKSPLEPIVERMARMVGPKGAAGGERPA